MRQEIHKLFGVVCALLYLQLISGSTPLMGIDWVLGVLLAYVFSGGGFSENILKFGISPDFLEKGSQRRLLTHSGVLPFLALLVFGAGNVLLNIAVLSWVSHILLDMISMRDEEEIKVDYRLWQFQELGLLAALIISLLSLRVIEAGALFL